MVRIVRAERAYRKIPAVRESAFEPGPNDQAIIEWVKGNWHAQDDLLLPRDRMVEENIRMLAGQQWSVFSRVLGRFVDLSHYLTDRQRAFRQRPVVNRLLLWFMLTHARLTESPPVIAFEAATGDWISRDLAEVMDPVFKILWRDTQMLEVLHDIASWLMPGGTAFWQSFVDPNMGDVIEWRGPAVITAQGPDGVVVERVIPDAPYGKDGQPLVQATENGEWEVTGKAFREHEGGIRVAARSTISVRGQWGNTIPWHEKLWHGRRMFLTPEEVFDTYGVDHEPEIRGEAAYRVQRLRKIEFGAGFFGSTDNVLEGLMSLDRQGSEGFIEVYEQWHKPLNFPSMEGGTVDRPGGRLTACTKTLVLRDGPRPANYAGASSIQCVDFVRVPGRPGGTTPQEAMNPVARSYNRGYGQYLEHRNLQTNPIGLYDRSQGIEPDMITNEPGLMLGVNRKPGNTAPPLEYVRPPDVGEGAYRVQAMLRSEMDDLAQIPGSEGRAPTTNASGELVKELRFNADRYVGPPLARLALALGRTVEDWMAILPTIWTREKVLSFTGDNNVLRAVTVTPHMFTSGKVKVIPNIESMLPEGRGEREERIFRLLEAGLLGDIADPQTQRRALEMLRFPHMSRTLLPGGRDAVMAETENGELARGVPAAEIAIYPWQDHDEHLRVHEDFMKSPAYQELAVPVQQQFFNHWVETREARLRSLVQQATEETELAVAAQLAQMSAMDRAGILPPPVPDEQPPAEAEAEIVA